ncbi:DivIVA domain-containing protein [Mesoplasma chauliocola]|uniref:DivIVA domain-containing protein n=1 Tax=Mesoplasma chauliocola TaxID=216427 RepID=A0A249SMZ0_9MOLU|nr:DivIVA domain-containing protein [Mesoplasma chauliocola]ASZ08962.1 DivIVA domain-containing protein [Mesoplasma chauliocola]
MNKPKILAEQILHQKFPTEFQGYKMESVNDFLDEVIEQMKWYEDEVKILNKTVEEQKIKISELEAKNIHNETLLADKGNEINQLVKSQLSNSTFVKQSNQIEAIQKSVKEIRQMIEKLENR